MCERSPIRELVVLVALAVSAQAGIVVYVDGDATDEPYDGSSWCHAYLTLHEALAVVQPGTTIRVADGTYWPDGAGLEDPREATFQLLSGVAIEGGYAGCGAADPDERDVAAYETTLSGDLGVADDPNDNCYHVVTGSYTDETAALDGLSITAGNADQYWDSDNSCGGGMFNDAGSPILRSCRVHANSAMGPGGGVYSFEGHPALINCTFSQNWAYDGGGVCNQASTPELIGCTFSGNEAARGTTVATRRESSRSYCSPIGGQRNQPLAALEYPRPGSSLAIIISRLELNIAQTASVRKPFWLRP